MNDEHKYQFLIRFDNVEELLLDDRFESFGMLRAHGAQAQATVTFAKVLRRLSSASQTCWNMESMVSWSGRQIFPK